MGEQALAGLHLPPSASPGLEEDEEQALGTQTEALGPYDIMPLPERTSESADERTARARALLCMAFARADVRAVCPSGHRLAVQAASGARKRLCKNCQDRISGVFVTCEEGHFAACIRCALKVATPT